MSRTRLLLALLIGAGLWQGVQWWRLRPVTQPDGVLAPEDPEQTALSADPVLLDGYTLTPRARYHLRARLLSREAYHWGREADLSPLDFALGWGPMSDSRVLRALDISQSSRFFWVRWENEPPIGETQMMWHAANTHLIPADAGVRRQLGRVRPGQVVQLDGILMDISAADGWHWNTSLTREDIGAGACEILWVQSFSLISRGR